MRTTFGRSTALIVLVTLFVLGAVATTASASTSIRNDKSTFIFADVGTVTTLDLTQVYQGDPMRNVGFELGGTLFAWDMSKMRGAGCNQMAGPSDVKPELAESATWEPATSSWLIKLKSMKSDAGNPLTAADVKFTFDRLILERQSVFNFLANSVASYGTVLGDITSNPVQIVNNSTVRFKVKARTATDLAVLTWMQTRIIDSVEAKKHATESDPWAKAWLQRNSPGYGPWKVSGFAPGSTLFLTANPNYWGPRGNLKKLVIRAVPDASTRRQLLETGKVDFAEKLSFSDYSSLTQKGTKTTGVKITRCFSANRTTMLLNQKDKTLANLKVRQAIQLAVDRGELAKAAYLGQYLASKHGVGASYQYKKSDKTAFPKVDVAKAKALLAEAGFPNGFKMNLTISPSRPGPEVDQLSVLMKAQLAKIGIDVNIVLIASSADFNAAFFAGNYQAMLYLEPPAIADEFYSLNLYNTTASFQNTFGYNNAQYDKLVGEIRVTPAGAARTARVAKVAEIIVETVPVVYITDNIFLHAVRDRFTGMVFPPNGHVYVHTLTATK